MVVVGSGNGDACATEPGSSHSGVPLWQLGHLAPDQPKPGRRALWHLHIMLCANADTRWPRLCRYSPNKLLALACIVFAAGNFIFATSNTLSIAYIGRMLAGVG